MVNWYALYVKSRHEFATGRELERKGVVTYVPAVKRWSQWKDRRKLIETPLFPGYLFVCVQPYPEYFINVLKTAGAVCLVCSEPGCPTPVDDNEILSLRLLVESGREIDIYPSLKEGNRVRIRRGPLKGAEGILAHRGEGSIFLVTVSLLGRAVGVKICAEDLEAA